MLAEAVTSPVATEGNPGTADPRIPLVGHWVKEGAKLRLAWEQRAASCILPDAAWCPGPESNRHFLAEIGF